MIEPRPGSLEPITGTLNVVLPPPAFHAQIVTRANFAGYHLAAAVAFARQADEIECATQGQAFDGTFLPIFWHVSSAVIMAAAALEAGINEIIKDTLDNTDTPPDRREIATKLIGPRFGLSFKYREIARSHGQAVDQSSSLYDDLTALIAFRNCLVHFEPEWDPKDSPRKELAKRLREKFDVRPNIVFPMSHLTYSCAKWAVDTAGNFSADYAGLIGVEDRLAGPEVGELDLPQPRRA